jgi:hypothetical protein
METKMKITKSQLRQIIKEARMAEYGKQDAAQGLPPSKVGKDNEEYMKAYNKEKGKLKKEEMSPEFLDSKQIMGLAIRAKREVEDARVSGDVNLDKLEVMLSKLVDGLPKVLK